MSTTRYELTRCLNLEGLSQKKTCTPTACRTGNQHLKCKGLHRDHRSTKTRTKTAICQTTTPERVTIK